MTHTLKGANRLVVLLVAAAAITLAGAGVAAAGTYHKTPGGTDAKIAGAVFFIAVNDGERGAGEDLFYYFSLTELKNRYGVETRDFDYTGHTVGSTVRAHGFSVAKLVASLVEADGRQLAVNDTWRIQYLEEDAFHATGEAYIDTVAAARNTTEAMLAFETRETFVTPTKYTISDATYRWAESQYPEYLRIYRQADSSSSATMKMILGITVSPDGAAYNTDTAGSLKLTGTDPDGKQVVVDGKGAAGRTLLGALAGMKLGVRAPRVPAYTPTVAHQLVDAVAPKATSTQTVNFGYTANRYLSAKDWTSGALRTYTENDLATSAQAVQIPHDLAFVEGLIGFGAAAVAADSIDPVTAEFTIPLPARKLFVDTRVIPRAYGYTDLYLYRYLGERAFDLAEVPRDMLANVVVTSVGGRLSLFSGDAAAACFVAFQDSRSKAAPNSTAENKRVTRVHDHPQVVDEHDGDVLVAAAARVDVNAPLVTALRVTTQSGKATVRIGRGRSVKLIATTTPRKTVEKLSWTSSSSTVATVSPTGKVISRRAGVAVITVKSSFGRKATFRVTVTR